MQTTYILIDLENVQPKSFIELGDGPIRIKVFIGSKQKNIPLPMIRALLTFGSGVELIQIEGSGKNALDFHVAYYIGKLAAEDPKARFQILSKDTGFDPLMKYLANQGIDCRRVESIGATPKTTGAKAKLSRLEVIIDNLQKRKAGKPVKVKTLRTTINARFGKTLGDEEIDELIAKLVEGGHIAINGDKVSYKAAS